MEATPRDEFGCAGSGDDSRAEAGPAGQRAEVSRSYAFGTAASQNSVVSCPMRSWSISSGETCPVPATSSTRQSGIAVHVSDQGSPGLGIDEEAVPQHGRRTGAGPTRVQPPEWMAEIEHCW